MRFFKNLFKNENVISGQILLYYIITSSTVITVYMHLSMLPTTVFNRGTFNYIFSSFSLKGKAVYFIL